MKVSASMESLWQYRLADKLLEGTGRRQVKEEEETEYISKEEVLAMIDSGLKDVKAGRSQSFEEFMSEWK